LFISARAWVADGELWSDRLIHLTA
jgi:hypothetical protein